MARPADVEHDSDAECEYSMQSVHQDCVNEGLPYFVKDDGSEDSFVAVKPWVGVVAPPTRPPPISVTAPSEDLQLEWVYGYDGQKIRGCVLWSAEGEVVFPVGKIAVIYKPMEGVQRYFHGHTDTIISAAISPSGEFVATGQLGRLPRVYVWHVGLLEQKALLRRRFKRGVGQLAFSKSGDILACISMDEEHTIALYHWRSETLLAVGQVGLGPVFCTAFSFRENVLAVGGSGKISFHHISGKHLRRRSGIWGKLYKLQPVLSIAYLEMGLCATGMADGSLYFWEGHTAKAVINAHSGPVYCLQVDNG